MSTRNDRDYAIDAGLRMIKVLEALEGTNFEPVSIKRVMERTNFKYDFCFRALRTLKLAGWATESPDGWQVGPRLLKFSERFNDLCAATVAGQ
jgi:DNA-binding IclR family transcriptional regulator